MFMAAKYPENIKNMVLVGANAYVSEQDAKIYRGKRVFQLSSFSKC